MRGTRTSIAGVCAGLVSCAAMAQDGLYGVSWAGNSLYRIDHETGVATRIGPLRTMANAAAGVRDGTMLYTNPQGTTLYQINPETGGTITVTSIVGSPADYGARAMALDDSASLWLVYSRTFTTELDVLVRVDPLTGQADDPIVTNRTDIQGLAFAPDGTLYAAAVGGAFQGELLRLDTTTGVATVVLGGLGERIQGIEFTPGGRLFASSDALVEVFLSTGDVKVIGPHVATDDMRGLAWFGAACYADFDGDGQLDFFDFLEYQNAFEAGDARADCDEDGELTFFDFLCFQNGFEEGCE